MGHVRTVDADELHTLRVLSRDVLVGGEIMDEAADNLDRKFVNVLDVAIDGIVLQHGNDLVVGLVVVQEPQAAYWAAVDDDVAVGDVLLREHAYIAMVVVSLHIVTGEGVIGLAGHALVAIGLRYEAVKGRNNIGELLLKIQTNSQVLEN